MLWQVEPIICPGLPVGVRESPSCFVVQPGQQRGAEVTLTLTLLRNFNELGWAAPGQNKVNVVYFITFCFYLHPHAVSVTETTRSGSDSGFRSGLAVHFNLDFTPASARSPW